MLDQMTATGAVFFKVNRIWRFGKYLFQKMFFDEHSTRIWWFATKINNGSHLALDDIKIAVLDRLLIQKLVNLGKAVRGYRQPDIPPIRPHAHSNSKGARIPTDTGPFRQ